MNLVFRLFTLKNSVKTFVDKTTTSTREVGLEHHDMPKDLELHEEDYLSCFSYSYHVGNLHKSDSTALYYL